MSRLIISATLDGIRTKVDKTVSVTFGTQEITPDDMGELFAMHQQFVSLEVANEDGLRTHAQQLEHANKGDHALVDGKTPSQRLRNVLWTLWNNSDQDVEFDTFYVDKINEIIDHFKSKIE